MRFRGWQIPGKKPVCPSGGRFKKREDVPRRRLSGKVERVEVAAIILVGGGSTSPSRRAGEETLVAPEFLAGVPLALQPLLGSPAVLHMASQLRSQGVGRLIVLSEGAAPALSKAAQAEQKTVGWQQVEEGQIWRTAENSFIELAQRVDEILVLRMGGYLQLDVQDLLAHHYENRCRVSAVVTADGKPLQVFAISANRRNDAAQLFRSGLKQMRTPCKNYVFRGYSNPLETAADFRSLTIDALLQKVPIAPRGREVRPGVWLASEAMVHPTARLVPPVYVGERTQVMPGALVTRCAVLEHCVRISERVVVENATVLPYTRVGAGLELKHCVAGGRCVAHLRHRVAMEVGDGRLLRSIPQSGTSRLVQRLDSLIASCSLQSLGRMMAKLSTPKAAGSGNNDGCLPAFEHVKGGERQEQREFAGDVAVARRYGDQ